MPAHAADLKRALDRLYDSFNAPDSAFDPIQVVQRYPRHEDREVVGFVASAVAFGRVASVVNSTNAICAVLGERPAALLKRFDPARDGGRLRPLVHRWTRGDDFVALLWILKSFVQEHGSIEAAFASGMSDGDVDVGPSIEAFGTRAREVDLSPAYGQRGAGLAGARPPGVFYFFPRPSTGSACKRMNLYLRWMVRKDAVDPGGWMSVPASKLVVPLDTHIIRVARCLKLTRYQSPGWKMATDITASLRRLDPADPVKYDFSLCHLGMMRGCSFGTDDPAHVCQLAGICQPKPGRSTLYNRGRKRRVA